MSQQSIFLGTVANDDTGDDLRTAGDKINDNFTELYAADATHQPLDSDLTSIAALTTVAYGRSLLTMANAAALAAEVDPFITSLELVAANRTYFVRTDGSDANTGLVDSAGGAFLTIQHALDLIYDSLFIGSGVVVTVQVRDGTYDESLEVRPHQGPGRTRILGNNSNPEDVIIAPTATPGDGVLSLRFSVRCNFEGFTLDGTAMADDRPLMYLFISDFDISNLNLIQKANSNNYSVRQFNAQVAYAGDFNFTLSGTQLALFEIDEASFVTTGSGTWTITGSPVFSEALFRAQRGSNISLNNDFVGSVTGPSLWLTTGSRCIDARFPIVGDDFIPGDAPIIDNSSAYDPLGLGLDTGFAAAPDRASVGVMKLAAAPTITELPIPGTHAVVFDTVANTVRHYANRAGTIVELNGVETFVIALSDETTALTTGTNKATFSLPYALTVISVYASVNTVSSSGPVTVDINEAGTTILSTKITIDVSEKTSATAAAAVISDAAIAANAEIGFDIDAAGTGAKGLKVVIQGVRT